MKWPTYDDFQFSKKRLKIEDELGEGQFGKVYFAWAKGIVKGEEQTRVAVKTMKQGSSQETAEDFRKEMEIMMDFDHPNIVRLLGICTRDEPLYLITELMKHGDLKAFIRKARPNETHPRSLLSIVQLVDIAAQAAAGVAYLASRLFVHRDIAARNCLVGENDNQLSVKVSDFGMARDIYQEEYYRRKGGTMPIRWMAPEAITDGKYTVESDVWSLGVLLWEIFVFGYQPYFGKSNEQVIGGILQGSLSLECPSLCPKSVYQFMLRCWERDPSDRIKSSDVANALQAMRDMGDISAGHLDVSSTASTSEDYTPMSSFTPPNSKFEEQPLLPQSNNAYYLDMSGGKAPSASSGQKRYVSAEPNKKVPLAGTSYVNATAQDLSNSPASYLNIASTRSKMPVEDDYTPMSSFAPRGIELDPMNKEEVSLPDITTMNDGNPLRDAPAEAKEKKKEKKLSSLKSTTYVNVMASTEDLDSATQTGKDDPSA
ncbi:insulin-like growth factor 1 receptor [Oscarella lobularis]|uniref:insulin-like growth factor 1 receptor n=1 Tax=Oscarella lobularis TaxID=121494 RepID=UPI003313F821